MSILPDNSSPPPSLGNLKRKDNKKAPAKSNHANSAGGNVILMVASPIADGPATTTPGDFAPSEEIPEDDALVTALPPNQD